MPLFSDKGLMVNSWSLGHWVAKLYPVKAAIASAGVRRARAPFATAGLAACQKLKVHTLMMMHYIGGDCTCLALPRVHPTASRQ